MIVDIISVVVFILVVGLLTETVNRYYYRSPWITFRGFGKRSLDMTPQLEQGKELMDVWKICMEDPIPPQSVEFCKNRLAQNGHMPAQSSFGAPAAVPLIN